MRGGVYSMSNVRREAVELLDEYIESHEEGTCDCDEGTGFMCLGMRVVGGSVDEEDAVLDLMESLG